jgi:hypothetical protein
MNGFRAGVASLAVLAAWSQAVIADVVTDWNEKACAIVGKAGQGAVGHRLMAGVQVSVYDAVKSAPAGASLDAAVAAANRVSLAELVPSEKAAVEAAYQAAIARIADGPAKADGIAAGEKAAAMVVARVKADGSDAAENYAPHTSAGRYVPTMIPAATSWPRRKPWVLASASQFRPGPPPELASETWEKDLHEVKMLGAKNSGARTPEQTAIAAFWEETRPLIYHGIVRSAVLATPGRSVADNARLFAALTMAMDDALIAVFDAKYYYNFWRPVTALRNDHTAGRSALKADLGWTPFIPTPMHPEYPCAHCVVSGAVGSVLMRELGDRPLVLRTSSPTAHDASREWKTVAEFMSEVGNARIYDGVHYRNSTVVGQDIGVKVGNLVMDKYAR